MYSEDGILAVNAYFAAVDISDFCNRINRKMRARYTKSVALNEECIVK